VGIKVWIGLIWYDFLEGQVTSRRERGNKRLFLYYGLFSVAEQPLVGQDLIIDALRSRHDFDTPHSVGFLRTSDQPLVETSTWQHTTFALDKEPSPRRDSNPEPTIPASERQQTHALDRAAIGIGILMEYGAMWFG
jgi:hypothetical protein